MNTPKGLEIRKNLKLIPSLEMGGLVMEGALHDYRLELIAPLLPSSKPLPDDRGTINGIVCVSRPGDLSCENFPGSLAIS